jgi:hypothetical protein
LTVGELEPGLRVEMGKGDFQAAAEAQEWQRKK